MRIVSSNGRPSVIRVGMSRDRKPVDRSGRPRLLFYPARVTRPAAYEQKDVIPSLIGRSPLVEVRALGCKRTSSGSLPTRRGQGRHWADCGPSQTAEDAVSRRDAASRRHRRCRSSAQSRSSIPGHRPSSLGGPARTRPRSYRSSLPKMEGPS